MASKPAIRNLLLNQTKKDFAVAMVVGIICAAAYQFGVESPKRAKIEEFHRNFDPEAAYQRMKAAGVFQYYRGDD